VVVSLDCLLTALHEAGILLHSRCPTAAGNGRVPVSLDRLALRVGGYYGCKIKYQLDDHNCPEEPALSNRGWRKAEEEEGK